ncbi:MFS transporter [Brevibacterium samyangense]
MSLSPGDRQHARPRIWPLFLATFLSTYTFAVANISVPGVQASLGVNGSQTALMIGAYTVSFAAGLIICGRLGDRYGRRRLFRIGTASMIVTSLITAAAPNLGLLILGRLLQGVSAAITTPQILASVQAMLTGPARSRAIGMYSIVAGVGTIGGQILGGLINSLFPVEYGWRAAMLSIGLIAAIALVGTLWLRDTRSPNPEGLDVTGSIVVALTLFVLITGLTNASSVDPTHPWSEPLTLVSTLALLVLAVGGTFLLWQHIRGRALAQKPSVLPLHVIREPGVRIGVTLAAVFFCMLGGFMYNFAVLTQQGFGWSPLKGGIALLALAGSFVLASSFATRLHDLWGPKVLVIGAGVQSIGLAALAVLAFSPTSNDTFLWLFQICALFTGGGQGLMMGPLVSVVMNTVPTRVAGLTGGLVATGQQAGMGLGVATLSSFFTFASDHVPVRTAFGLTVTLTIAVSCLFGLLAMQLVRPVPGTAAGAAAEPA